MVGRDLLTDEKVINLKTWKLRKKHKRIYKFLNKIKKFLKRNKNKQHDYTNKYQRSVNH